jgi:hypothetical protein
VFNIIEAVDGPADVVAVDLPEAADFHGGFGDGTLIYSMAQWGGL